MTDAPEHIADPAPASEARADIHLPPPADPVPAERPKRRRRGGGAGRHFGPRPVADPLDAWLPGCRCTKAQRAEADAEAARAGVSLNGFVRQKIFGSPGRRAHRNPSSLDVATAQLAAQMGKGQSLLNQGIHAAHRIALGAPETNSRDRLADLLEDMFELLRPAVAENRECLAAAHALLRLRQDDAEGAF